MNPVSINKHTDKYVADTHALVWKLCATARLGVAAQAVFARADADEVKVHIPVVVVAELAMIAQKQRIPGFDDESFETAIHALQKHPAYISESLDLERVLASRPFSGIPDIFDRLVITDAVVLQAAVITKDPVIRDSGLVTTVWA
uniref:PIN domain nuclease, a component of toxin-antitoxin system (PIN domain) n=1 Tax=Candidatus Kentrum sp. MB TaxID=2138164 RepID=A0A450XM25_9GAMM|nr:MAG: PIN domain nuclease, a component of toxin-antitoxin system (PIN domain) [Candidatus Kentron sp. MB]VFK30351.1 MAG: PIN domain nuclease, a component of toxin-antitoxin system (PIN domain) [Candidatus Kentron sp. MB]VFK75181.1 MAG: PIN domain nuclease, a component of toxin-antitoxin system (PIN domain) [Candidatus Kentron sp. MB]